MVKVKAKGQTLSKKNILDNCYSIVRNKMELLRNQINELIVDAESDSKSSAGDKHETARAMMQLEQEKLNRQLAELIKQEEVLNQIRFDESHDRIQLGSVIQTDRGNIFLSIPLGKMNLDQSDYMVISPVSPFGKTILGLSDGTSFEVNNTKYQVLKIY